MSGKLQRYRSVVVYGALALVVGATGGLAARATGGAAAEGEGPLSGIPILGDVIGGLYEIGSSIIDGIATGLNEAVQALLGIPIAAFNTLADVFAQLLAIPLEVVSLINEVFSAGIDAIIGGGGVIGQVLATGDPAATGTALGLPQIAWAIIGLTIVGAGVGIYNSSDEISAFIPVGGSLVGEAGEGTASFLIVLGSMIAIWGFFPDNSQYLFAALFVVVFATAAFGYRNIVQEATDIQ